jgi:hypothetical protein
MLIRPPICSWTTKSFPIIRYSICADLLRSVHSLADDTMGYFTVSMKFFGTASV